MSFSIPFSIEEHEPGFGHASVKKSLLTRLDKIINLFLQNWIKNNVKKFKTTVTLCGSGCATTATKKQTKKKPVMSQRPPEEHVICTPL